MVAPPIVAAVIVIGLPGSPWRPMLITLPLSYVPFASTIVSPGLAALIRDRRSVRFDTLKVAADAADAAPPNRRNTAPARILDITLRSSGRVRRPLVVRRSR